MYIYKNKSVKNKFQYIYKFITLKNETCWGVLDKGDTKTMMDMTQMKERRRM